LRCTLIKLDQNSLRLRGLASHGICATELLARKAQACLKRGFHEEGLKRHSVILFERRSRPCRLRSARIYRQKATPF